MFSPPESYYSQLESNCLALERQIQLCDGLHAIKANLATCEQQNLLLATISHTCKADNFRLESILSSCQDELSCLSADHDTILPRLKAQPVSQPELIPYKPLDQLNSYHDGFLQNALELQAMKYKSHPV